MVSSSHSKVSGIENVNRFWDDFLASIFLLERNPLRLGNSHYKVVTWGPAIETSFHFLFPIVLGATAILCTNDTASDDSAATLD